MTKDQLLGNLRSEPFRPFFLRMGELRYPVTAPDAVMLMGHQVVYIDRSDAEAETVYLELKRIQDVEFFPKPDPRIAMNADAVRQLLRAQPFEPFRIHLSNKTSYDVRHPEQVLLLASRVLYGEPTTDKYTILSLAHINAMEMLTTGMPASSAA